MTHKNQSHDRHFWRDITLATATFALGALAILIVRVIFLIPDLSDAVTKIGNSATLLPITVNDQATGIRDDLSNKVTAALGIAQGEIRDTRRAAVMQIAITREELLAEIQGMHQDGVSISVAGLRLVDRHASAVEDQIGPVLGVAETTMNEFNTSQRDLRPQMLGLVAASKILVGESAQTMKVVRDATPALIASQEQIAANVAEITKDAATMADKFAKPKTKKEIFLELLIPTALIGSRFF